MMRRKRARRGEMLIETIVAFAVLMILLTMVTTVVRSAIALNNRATKRLNDLAEDCERLESANYAGGIDDMLTLTLVPAQSSVHVIDPIEEELRIYEGSELSVFHLKDDDGTNTGGGSN